MGEQAKKVLYFGIYNPDFIRNKVIMLGFARNGYEVVECRVDPKKVPGLKKYIVLYQMGKRIDPCDFTYIIVGFPGALAVPLARILFGSRIIFDAFLSQFDTNVYDRKLYAAFSLRGIQDRLYDWLSCVLALRVLLPERAQIEYFVKTFHIDPRKFVRVFTGANDEIFRPLPSVQKESTFTVHFHGNFIPLQGVEYIVEAASILKGDNIHFQFVGAGGKMFEDTVRRIAAERLINVELLGRKPLEEIPSYIARAHICLGVFGSSDKAKRVISNKVYEYLACGAPVITARTRAMQELLTDREDVLFCNSSDGEDLAAKILQLKDDRVLRERIAHGGRKLFDEKLKPSTLVSSLISTLESQGVS